MKDTLGVEATFTPSRRGSQTSFVMTPTVSERSIGGNVENGSFSVETGADTSLGSSFAGTLGQQQSAIDDGSAGYIADLRSIDVLLEEFIGGFLAEPSAAADSSVSGSSSHERSALLPTTLSPDAQAFQQLLRDHLAIGARAAQRTKKHAVASSVVAARAAAQAASVERLETLLDHPFVADESGIRNALAKLFRKRDAGENFAVALEHHVLLQRKAVALECVPHRRVAGHSSFRLGSSSQLTALATKRQASVSPNVAVVRNSGPAPTTTMNKPFVALAPPVLSSARGPFAVNRVAAAPGPLTSRRTMQQL